jgi:S-adenosylmethionine/arginine decarboxylase-like enzyme
MDNNCAFLAHQMLHLDFSRVLKMKFKLKTWNSAEILVSNSHICIHVSETHIN